MKELVDWSNQSVIEEKHQPVWENRAEYWLVLFQRTNDDNLANIKTIHQFEVQQSNYDSSGNRFNLSSSLPRETGRIRWRWGFGSPGMNS
jgi:sorbitol-specific phosphotransferase system component IIA